MLIKNRDSSVGILTGYEMDSRGSIPGKGNAFLPYLANIRTGSGAQTIQSVPGLKRPVHETDRSRLYSTEEKNDEALPSLPICLHSIVIHDFYEKV